MSDANVNTTHVEPQVVHLEHSLEPARAEISDAVRKKHDVSKLRYPFLNLSEGEYIVTSVRRHPIGLIGVLFVTALLMAAASIFYGWYSGLATRPETIGMQATDLPSAASVFIPFVLFMILVALGGFIAGYVYLQNKFFLTNETVIQEIQTSLFSRREQIISLSNVEDVGFSQSGILQMIFDYGSIRLSTIGDENTYRFSFVAAPKDQVARLNDAVEDFKNGRPVDVS